MGTFVTLERREIFWERERHHREEIEAEARRLADLYGEQTYSDDIWFAWCVAAERHLTAQRIAVQRHQAWETIRELKGYNDLPAGNPLASDRHVV